uniref:Uncharacterized protein n=1 Tax=Arundo donax TaxID=35708 RepID=A0A0A9GEU6_ARUDO
MAFLAPPPPSHQFTLRHCSHSFG